MSIKKWHLFPDPEGQTWYLLIHKQILVIKIKDGHATIHSPGEAGNKEGLRGYTGIFVGRGNKKDLGGLWVEGGDRNFRDQVKGSIEGEYWKSWLEPGGGAFRVRRKPGTRETPWNLKDDPS